MAAEVLAQMPWIEDAVAFADEVAARLMDAIREDVKMAAEERLQARRAVLDVLELDHEQLYREAQQSGAVGGRDGAHRAR